MAVAFAVVVPFFFLGIPSGHDFEFHVHSWMEVLGQWKAGILYPRWAALAHYGHGEPRFVFYPPFSWMLGAILGAVLPWKLVSGAYIWLALTFSGCSMFALARRWLDRRDAIFAAALYAANPYYILIVYWRSAFAELLAGALLPLLLLYVFRLEEEQARTIVPLSLVLAGAWLTNAPAAVMVNYSVVLLAVVLALLKRTPRILFIALIASALGATLAAFYVFPAAYEQRWVNIAQVLSPGVHPSSNFLFTVISDPLHNAFNRLVSVIAASEIIVLVIALFVARAWRQTRRTAFWMLIVWASAATLLMFSFTVIFWEHLPKLRFVQLPWRWLLCLNVAFALFVTIAWRRWWLRLAICLIMLAALAFGWHRLQKPWWDTAKDVAIMLQQHQSAGYEGTDEYVPINADNYEINPHARRATFDGPGTAHIYVKQWDAQAKLVTAQVSSSGELVTKLFNYPAWKVEVNGRAVSADTREVTGQMMVPLQAGTNDIRITFTRTWDRTLGGVISLVAVVLMLVVLLWRPMWHLINMRSRAL